MVITHKKIYKKIKSELKKSDKIGIIGCNACARICKTGGEKEMKALKRKLEKDGYDVVDMDLIPLSCNLDLVKKPQYKGNTLIVLACDVGPYALKKTFPEKKIIPALKTIGIGARDSKDNLYLVRKF